MTTLVSNTNNHLRRWKAIKIRTNNEGAFYFDLLDGSYYRGFDGQLENEIERPLNHCRSKSVHSKISPTRPWTLELETQR